MSAGEQHASRCEPIHIRRHCLRVPVQATNPVIQVIDCNEQNVGPIFGTGWTPKDDAQQEYEYDH
jgi:hypothetical protein